MHIRSPRLGLSLLAALALAPLGCKGGAPALAKGEPTDEPPPEVPSPPADGPKLVVLQSGTVVYDRPSTKGKPLGELRAGAQIARSSEPFTRRECPGGWYVVRPRGFVCAGEAATTDPSLAAALPPGPDLSRPLPYRYGRARTEGVPLYTRLPMPAEQAHAEPDLKRYLSRRGALDDEVLGAAADDVPLDPRGVPTGPPVLMPGVLGANDVGRRTVGSFFAFPSPVVPPLAPLAPRVADLEGGVLRKNSGVALAGSFTSSLAPEASEEGRRFGVTPSGHVVAIDRLRPALGTTWHGLDVEKVGLPVAFVHKAGVTAWNLKRGEAEPLEEEELERRTAVPLTGKFRTVNGVRFEQSREGYWVRAQDLVVIVRRTKFPDFAKGDQKWMDVSLANQTLTAYEGQKPVYVTLISSGRDVLKDAAESASTARGTFRVRKKLVTAALDSREVHGDFDVNDAPWVMEFEPGYALTGTYWGDGLGEAQTFHAVALSPVDARRLFHWSGPELPEGWHGVTDAMGEGTTVVVRP
ncbi:L,D-transpeptidase [Polyangium spumosum]|uniref:L,D-transpeptidase family protein n=1 Tax=Polyangium spumosum TaxID=889282 RepID=A0A6N7PL42_9BACT|nr:L,D-transpeptidase [Polyangium spumosum]MRG90825.1 L,D-transpeptidase family protein [Polyangium spumosum]